jgi:peptide/nickel transport system substrate-binding protein
MLAVGAGLLVAAALAERSRTTRNGGTFRISLMAGFPGVDYIDPALADSPGDAALLNAACGTLFTTSRTGQRLVPELAARFPRISRDGKTYTFTVKANQRFNNGARVTAAAFAHEIYRVLDHSMQSPAASYVQDIVGAAAVIAGRANEASGIRARGNKLTLSLTKPVPDLVARLSTTFFCAVPSNLPVDPEGVAAPLPSAGPYFISKYVPGRRIEIGRNRRYRGTRPHHLSAFAVELGDDPDTILHKIERGDADWGFVPNQVIGAKADEYAAKYGVNKSQFLVKPGATFLRFFSLNSARPLLRNNPSLRRALNFAIDRKALLAARGGRFTGTETDQYLIPGVPGFRNARIYPLDRSNLKKAKALAKGHLRSRRAALYVPDSPVPVAQAQIVQAELAKIGLRVSITSLPGSAYFDAIATPGEPVDIAWYGWAPGELDPYDMLNAVLHPRPGELNIPANYHVPRYDRLLAKAARLTGPARYRMYGNLDVELARKQAPLLPYSYDNQLVLVSKRVGCVVFDPYFDLSAACLK